MDTEKHFIVTHHGKLYKIDDFLKIHPGGENYLKPYKDKEISEHMKRIQHSNAAYHLLKQYKEEDDETNNNEAQENLDTLVDLDKPILSQLSKLDERYIEWVMLPVSKRLRFFQNELCESLTFTPWYVVPIFWIPIIFCLMWYGTERYLTITGDPSPLLPVVLHSTSGVLLWTIFEYALHRWIFHIKPSGKSKAMIYFHFLVHGMHHKAPYDVYRLVFPPFPGVIIACMVYMTIWPVSPDSIILLRMAGIVTGYLIYDMIHFYLHFGTPTRSYFYYLKRYHLQHHFVSHDSGFGISSDFWDKIFGSVITLKKLAKSINW